MLIKLLLHYAHIVETATPYLDSFFLSIFWGVGGVGGWGFPSNHLPSHPLNTFFSFRFDYLPFDCLFLLLPSIQFTIGIIGAKAIAVPVKVVETLLVELVALPPPYSL